MKKKRIILCVVTAIMVTWMAGCGREAIVESEMETTTQAVTETVMETEMITQEVVETTAETEITTDVVVEETTEEFINEEEAA